MVNLERKAKNGLIQKLDDRLLPLLRDSLEMLQGRKISQGCWHYPIY